MSNEKPWQDLTPDEQANEIRQIKMWLLRISESLVKIAEKINAIVADGCRQQRRGWLRAERVPLWKRSRALVEKLEEGRSVDRGAVEVGPPPFPRRSVGTLTIMQGAYQLRFAPFERTSPVRKRSAGRWAIGRQT